MRVLNDTEIATFRSDGVVHLPGAVDKALVAEILESVDRLIESPGRFGGSMTTQTASGRFFQDRYLHPTHQDFHRYARDCGLAISAATATGSSKIHLYYDHVFVKEPGTQEQFVWHQERP